MVLHADSEDFDQTGRIFAGCTGRFIDFVMQWLIFFETYSDTIFQTSNGIEHFLPFFFLSGILASTVTQSSGKGTDTFKFHKLFSYFQHDFFSSKLAVDLKATNLTLFCLVDYSILINWMSPFPFLGCLVYIFIFVRNSCQQIVYTLILVYTVCLGPIKGNRGKLQYVLVFLSVSHQVFNVHDITHQHTRL